MGGLRILGAWETSAKRSLAGEPDVVAVEGHPELLVVGGDRLALAGERRRRVQLHLGEQLLHLLDGERRAGAGPLLLLLGLQGLVGEGVGGLVDESSVDPTRSQKTTVMWRSSWLNSIPMVSSSSEGPSAVATESAMSASRRRRSASAFSLWRRAVRASPLEAEKVSGIVTASPAWYEGFMRSATIWRLSANVVARPL